MEHTFLSYITDWVGVGAISGCSDVEPGVIAGMQHTQDALRCPSGGIRRHFDIQVGVLRRGVRTLVWVRAAPTGEKRNATEAGD